MTVNLDLLNAEKYVLLTTFRKSGEGVSTPIWIAADQDELLIWTERNTGKVKRIRNDSQITLQGCDARGKKTHGPVLTGQATILDESATKRVNRAISQKYGLIGRIFLFFSRLRGANRTVALAITLDTQNN